jgi:aminopeptidase N
MMREFAMPGSRPRYSPDRVCAVRHIKLDIVLDVDARRISGTCTLTLSPLVSGATWLRLDAVELDIARVTRGGSALEHQHDGKVLRVALGEVTEAEAFDLEIAYSGQPRRGIYFVGPDDSYPDKPLQVWTQGQDQDSRFWFPCFDAPSEKATSEIIATVPARFTAVSNGELVSDEKSGDKRTMHWRFDVPHSCYLMTLVAGEMAEIRERWNGIDLTYYVQPGREEDARRALGRTPAMLELFSRRFGVPYPYTSYAQLCVADFIFGGMENTTATTLTDTILYDERAALDFDADALVAHELAHQWFGDLLTCRAWAEGWLNEGFATYSEYLWREAHEGRDEADHEMDDWGEQYFAEDAGRYRRIIATNVYDEPIDIFDHHLYEKGGRVLHMLRQVLGDDSFFRVLKHYLGKHRGGSVETRDLARAVEDATGRQMDWFFDQWIVKGAGHPELEVGYEWDADKKLACFTVKQTHKVEGATPLFRMPAALALDVDGARRRVEIEVSEQQHTFYVSCESEPGQAIFDPGKALLARVKSEKPVPMWIAELAGAELAIDRVHAARELGTRGGARATEALVEALGGDRSWTVQAAAADALGKLRSDTARDALIAAVETTKHPRARRSVVRALGQFRGDEKAGAALAEVVERGDASYFVEAEACLSLGRTRWPVAGELLRQAAERDSFIDVIRQHAYRGLAEARDEEAISFLLEATQYGKVSHGRRAAVAALAELVRGRRDRAEREVRERIEELLRDTDFRVQFAALESLAVLADPASVPALRDVVDRELDGRLRRRAREIVRDIGEAHSGAAEVSSLRDDVEKMRGDLARLREQLERMQAASVEAPPDGVRPRNGAPARRAPTVKDTVRRPAKGKAAARGKRAAKTKSPR